MESGDCTQPLIEGGIEGEIDGPWPQVSVKVEELE